MAEHHCSCTSSRTSSSARQLSSAPTEWRDGGRSPQLKHLQPSKREYFSTRGSLRITSQTSTCHLSHRRHNAATPVYISTAHDSKRFAIEMSTDVEELGATARRHRFLRKQSSTVKVLLLASFTLDLTRCASL